MGALLQFSFEFETIVCYKCQMQFAVPSASRTRWVQKGDEFWCPNGHSQHYSETENQKLKKELEAEKQRTEWARQSRDLAQKERDRLKHVVAAEKGAKTKLKNRIANGVCPCCHRSFQNLKNHIAHKHPSFKKDES